MAYSLDFRKKVITYCERTPFKGIEEASSIELFSNHVIINNVPNDTISKHGKMVLTLL